MAGWPISRGDDTPLSFPELEGHINADASGLLFRLLHGAGTPMQALMLAQPLPNISITSQALQLRKHSAEQKTRITDSDPKV